MNNFKRSIAFLVCIVALVFAVIVWKPAARDDEEFDASKYHQQQKQLEVHAKLATKKSEEDVAPTVQSTPKKAETAGNDHEKFALFANAVAKKEQPDAVGSGANTAGSTSSASGSSSSTSSAATSSTAIAAGKVLKTKLHKDGSLTKYLKGMEVHIPPKVVELIDARAKKSRLMFYDQFTFHSEIDLLEVRIAEMDDVIDIFILVEANVSFTGEWKPLFYVAHRHRIPAKFLERVVHVVITDFDAMIGTLQGKTLKKILKRKNTPWRREDGQRAAMHHALRALDLRRGDLVHMSDADHFPRNSVLKQIREETEAGSRKPFPIALVNDFFYYNYRSFIVNNTDSTQVFLYTGKNIEQIAMRPHRIKYSARVMRQTGWHCSWCFPTIEDYQIKFRSYAHSETNLEVNTNVKNIQDSVCKPSRPFREGAGNDFKFEKLPLDHKNVPRYILANPDKFPYLLPKDCTLPYESWLKKADVGVVPEKD